MGALIKAYYPEAASGTVEVFKHGTITRAEVFADWAGEEPTTDYAIDGSGRWKGFVFELVDVRVKDVNGLQVDAWTDGTQDTLVAVQNTGFTGTLEDGSQGNGGIVSLSEILTRIRTSFGAVDGFVRETGTTTDLLLKDALHSVRSANFPFFVVTDAAYGAVGDGVTDDKTAIQKALDAATAAGGGIVFFPGGKTYLLTGGLLVSSNTVSLFGAGATSSILKISTSNIVLLTFNAGVATFGGSFVSGLGFDSSAGAQTNAIEVTTAPGYTFERLRIRNFISGIKLQSKAIVRNVDFLGINSVALASYAVWATGLSDGACIEKCSLEAGLVFVASSVVLVDVDRVVVDGCEILHRCDGNNGVRVNAAPAGPVKVVNCNFRRAAGAVGILGSWISVSGQEFSESDNTFQQVLTGGFLYFQSSANTAVHRGSREKLRASWNIGAGTVTLTLEHGEHMITGNGTPFTVAVPVAGAAGNGSPSDRMLLRYTVRNTTGAPINVTNSAVGSGTHINGAVVAVPAGKTATWTLKFNETAVAWDEVSFATG